MRIYRAATALAYARGYDDGRRAQALDDEDLTEAIGQWVMDREALGRDVGAVMRATVEDLRAISYRRRN
ncbi:hypothetical protein [Brevibacterium yomogidense]|uniref:hypothetical protein n=1 Tax=Brevibacterium yomogidense TaxID=946573 RepID=UPI0018E00576|nr:hypothetical protein [Brevibacterium yomogidense]